MNTSENDLVKAHTDSKTLNHFYKRHLKSHFFFSDALFFLFFFCILFYTRSIVLPLVFALLFDFLLAPLVTLLNKYHIPAPLSALLIILILLVIIGIGCFGLIDPALSWIAKGQEIVDILNKKVVELQQFFIGSEHPLIQTDQKIHAVDSISTKAIEVVSSIFITTESFLISIGITIFLLYFLLISENFLFHKIVRSTERENKKDVVIIFSKVKHSIWRYLFARTMINIGLGFATAILLYLVGMPNPILWGTMVAILEYIPVVGALASVIVIFAAAIFTFVSFWYAFFIVFLFSVIVAIEANVITPIVIGKTVMLTPIIVFLSIMFWGFIWGVPGIFIAIPITVIIKIILETYYPHSFMNELLS